MGTSLVTVVTGAAFPLPVVAEVEVEILGVSMRGKCGVISGFSYDVLLGVHFPRRTPLLVDFRNITLTNPGPPSCMVAALFW